MVELFRFHLVVYLYYERSADFGHPDFKYFSKMDFFVSKEKIFFYFLPSHPHTYGSNALFIGVSSVRASVRASFCPHTLSPALFRQESPACLRFT